jgi:hypothetical protein
VLASRTVAPCTASTIVAEAAVVARTGVTGVTGVAGVTWVTGVTGVTVAGTDVAGTASAVGEGCAEARVPEAGASGTVGEGCAEARVPEAGASGTVATCKISSMVAGVPGVGAVVSVRSGPLGYSRTVAADSWERELESSDDSRGRPPELPEAGCACKIVASLGSRGRACEVVATAGPWEGVRVARG